MVTPVIIDSVEKFSSAARKLRDEWIAPTDRAILPWFRGQSNSEWELIPKFYRAKPTDLTTEREIREEFITHAPALCDIKTANEWEWYFLMQHYGAPTRLLDWTDGALFALYFAVRENTGDRHAAVWALDPWELNMDVLGKDEVIPPGDAVFANTKRYEHRWLTRRVGQLKAPPRLPIAVFPGHFDKRIGAQRSSFTIHGKELNGLMTWAKKNGFTGMRKFIVPSWEVRQIRRTLDSCGVDETTVFPNLEALSRVVEFRWKNPEKPIPHRHVYTRLKPSKIHGVGVFAIRKIRNDTHLFAGDLDEMVWVPSNTDKRMPREIRKLYQDFAPVQNGRHGCPKTFNRLTMSWYLNESKSPNVKCIGNYEFKAIKDINAGSELTVDYSDYPKVLS